MLWQRLGLVAGLVQLSSSYTPLSDGALKALPLPGADFNIKAGSLLAPILIPRVPGTPGSAKAREHLTSFFRTTLPDWHITFQNSSATTPTSNGQQIPFSNIIATRDPPWAQPGESGRLALVAHYDSKLTPADFIGATDSAAPCAMIMHAMRSIDKALTQKWEHMHALGVVDDALGDVSLNRGIQVLFLDGEEAFENWSDTDSLYGARSLAEEWESTANPAMSTYKSPLGSIELFVLLDLLGGKRPTVPSYFMTTHWAYQHMATAETRLREAGMFKSSPNHASRRDAAGSTRAAEPIFLTEATKMDAQFSYGGYIEDDHVPFLARGVEILHIIPTPFPEQWHTSHDDGEHLDTDTVEDWAMLVTVFVAEWLDLDQYLTPGSVGAAQVRDEL